MQEQGRDKLQKLNRTSRDVRAGSVWDVKCPGHPPARPPCSTSAELPVVVVCLCGAMHVGRGTNSRCPSKRASLHTNGRALDCRRWTGGVSHGGAVDAKDFDSFALPSRDMASFCVPVETASQGTQRQEGITRSN